MRLGDRAERLACAYLERRGLVLLERNYRLRLGEIDLIMTDQDLLVFVEVKYRSSSGFGSALEQVTPAKQRRIKMVAAAYLQRFSELPCVRFDVVGVSPAGSDFGFKWVKGAFE